MYMYSACIIFPNLWLAEAPEYLLELMTDKNTAIGKLCTKTLDIIAVSDCFHMDNRVGIIMKQLHYKASAFHDLELL